MGDRNAVRGSWRAELGRARDPRLVGAAACAAPLIAALILAFSAGGYFITSWGAAAIVLLLALAATSALIGVRIGGPLGLVAVAGWTGLAAWQGISGAWAADPAAATATMNLTLLSAAAFTLVLVGMRRASWLARLIDGALGVTVIVAAAAVAARTLPGLVGGDDEVRLSTPITYWNGLGAMAATGAVLALGLAGHPRRSRPVRALAGGLVPLLALCLLFTLSRGAVLVLIIALAALILLAHDRIATVVVATLTLGVSAPLVVHVNGEDALVALRGELPEHAAEGRAALALLLVAMVAAAALTLLAAVALDRLPRSRRRVVGATLTGIAAAVAVAGLVVLPPDGGPLRWAEDQFESFREFAPEERGRSASLADRLAVAAGSGRWQNWGVAVDQFERRPVVGTGAGDYRFEWNERRPIDQFVVNAHSQYLEVLGDSGLIGLGLFLAPLIAVITACGIALRRRPPPGLARDLGIALAAGSVMALHMIGDWDWQLPATVLPVIVLGAGALRAATMVDTAGRVNDPAPEPRAAGPALAARGLLIGGALLAALVIMGPTLAAVDVGDARRAAAGGELPRALDLARRAGDRDPQSFVPPLLEANILSDLGDAPAADRAFATAAARSPREWTVFADWAASLNRRGRRGRARVAARRALALNPRDPRTRVLMTSLGVR